MANNEKEGFGRRLERFFFPGAVQRREERELELEAARRRLEPEQRFTLRGLSDIIAGRPTTAQTPTDTAPVAGAPITPVRPPGPAETQNIEQLREFIRQRGLPEETEQTFLSSIRPIQPERRFVRTRRKEEAAPLFTLEEGLELLKTRSAFVRSQAELEGKVFYNPIENTFKDKVTDEEKKTHLALTPNQAATAMTRIFAEQSRRSEEEMREMGRIYRDLIKVRPRRRSPMQDIQLEALEQVLPERLKFGAPVKEGVKKLKKREAKVNKAQMLLTDAIRQIKMRNVRDSVKKTQIRAAVNEFNELHGDVRTLNAERFMKTLSPFNAK